MKSSIVGNWWLLALQGILTASIGILAIFKPEDLLQTLSLFIGIIIFISGAFVFITTIIQKNKDASSRWWTGAGIVLIFTGLILIFFPKVVMSIFIFILAFWIILMGVIQIQSAIDVKAIYGRWQLIMAGGIISLLLGIIFLFNPFDTAKTLTVVAGIYAVILGIVIVINAFNIKNLTSE